MLFSRDEMKRYLKLETYCKYLLEGQEVENKNTFTDKEIEDMCDYLKLGEL